ncbi:MAG: hypothetical protein H6573_11615 [Lewinellaceae bacterium]|nr:hypothetical protein [Lewinellaceae bacterium]
MGLTFHLLVFLLFPFRHSVDHNRVASPQEVGKNFFLFLPDILVEVMIGCKVNNGIHYQKDQQGGCARQPGY